MTEIEAAVQRLQNRIQDLSAKSVHSYRSLPDGEPVIFTYYSYADDEQKYVVGKIVRSSCFNRRGTKEISVKAGAIGHGTVEGNNVVEPIDINKSWRI